MVVDTKRLPCAIDTSFKPPSQIRRTPYSLYATVVGETQERLRCPDRWHRTQAYLVPVAIPVYHVELSRKTLNVRINIGYNDFPSDQQAARQEL